MLLGRISRLYFVVLLVWLVKRARFGDSFELFRGKYDVFSNKECSKTEDSDRALDDSFDTSRSDDDDCPKYGANCNDMACCYCICNRSTVGYTYIGNGAAGRCKRDEKVFPGSVPGNSFGVMNNNRGLCLRVDHFNDNIMTEQCSPLTPETRWIRTRMNSGPRRLMNIKTLQCVEVADGSLSVKMKPCNFNSPEQTLFCTSKVIWRNRRGRKKACLMLRSSTNPVLSAMIQKRSDAQKWKKHPSGNICGRITTYIGCYRFADGSFLRFLSYDEQCKQGSTCDHKEFINISAPIFAENAECSLNWGESTYSRYGNYWNSFKDEENYYFYLNRTMEESVKLLKVNISASKKLNGSLIKLNIICKGKLNRQREKHCVLLKFETLPGSDLEVDTTTTVPSTTEPSVAPTYAITVIKSSTKLTSSPITTTRSSKSVHSTLKATTEHPSHTRKVTTIVPSTTEVLRSSKSVHSTLKATTEHPSHMRKVTTITKLFSAKTITGFSMSTMPSKSNFSNRSSSSKVVAISVPIVLLVVIVCVAVGFFVIYRRRKEGQPQLTTNEEEMRSCESREAPNFSTNFYEDPQMTYEPLKTDRRGTDDEQHYQGLVGLNSQDKNTSVYDYIDEKSATNPGAEGEYSYASNENLSRSFSPSQPLPSAPIVYETLEQPDGLDNPTFDHDKLSDNNDPKNEPFDKQCKNPVYQTLEEQEAVQNPKLKLNDELTDKNLDSVAKESLDRQSQNPVYQTLENSNAGQDTSPETFGNSSPGDVPSSDPIYHVVDNP